MGRENNAERQARDESIQRRAGLSMAFAMACAMACGKGMAREGDWAATSPVRVSGNILTGALELAGFTDQKFSQDLFSSAIMYAESVRNDWKNATSTRARDRRSIRSRGGQSPRDSETTVAGGKVQAFAEASRNHGCALDRSLLDGELGSNRLWTSRR